jgi:hypothetical protein
MVRPARRFAGTLASCDGASLSAKMPLPPFPSSFPPPPSPLPPSPSGGLTAPKAPDFFSQYRCGMVNHGV